MIRRKSFGSNPINSNNSSNSKDQMEMHDETKGEESAPLLKQQHQQHVR
jgi:hypothetical protein